MVCFSLFLSPLEATSYSREAPSKVDVFLEDLWRKGMVHGGSMTAIDSSGSQVCTTTVHPALVRVSKPV